MAYEIFLNAPTRPSREDVDRALEGLDALPELEPCEIHELEDILRSPDEYLEELEWLLQIEEGYQDRFRAFCQQHGLNDALEPLDATAATRFMESLAGYDFAVIRLPGGAGEELDADEGEEADPDEVAAAWRALVAFAKRHGYRLMDPQFNDTGEFVDLKNPGELPPAYE